MEFYYFESKGGEQFLKDTWMQNCEHRGICSCDKEHKKRLKRYINIKKLPKWKVDLSDEISASVYLLENNNGTLMYISAASLKTRIKGSPIWKKLKLRPLKKLITNTIK